MLKNADKILNKFFKIIIVINNIPIELNVFSIFMIFKTLSIMPINGETLFPCIIFPIKGSKSAKLNDSKNAVKNIRKNNINTYPLNGFNKLNNIPINFKWTYPKKRI